MNAEQLVLANGARASMSSSSSRRRRDAEVFVDRETESSPYNSRSTTETMSVQRSRRDAVIYIDRESDAGASTDMSGADIGSVSQSTSTSSRSVASKPTLPRRTA